MFCAAKLNKNTNRPNFWCIFYMNRTDVNSQENSAESKRIWNRWKSGGKRNYGLNTTNNRCNLLWKWHQQYSYCDHGIWYHITKFVQRLIIYVFLLLLFVVRSANELKRIFFSFIYHQFCMKKRWIKIVIFFLNNFARCTLTKEIQPFFVGEKW